MIDLPRGLAARALEAIAALEARTVAADGGRLKLEWGTLRARAGDRVEDVLWWSGDQLLGFLGLYSYDGRSVELAGMVDPAARRQGIAKALIDAALTLCRERAYEKALLVTPRASLAGRTLALARGAALDHSEYALVLEGEPSEGRAGPELVIRPAAPADVPAIAELLRVAFGFTFEGVAMKLETPSARTVVVESDGAVIGTVRLTRDGDSGGIHGAAAPGTRHRTRGPSPRLSRPTGGGRSARGPRGGGAERAGPRPLHVGRLHAGDDRGLLRAAAPPGGLITCS